MSKNTAMLNIFEKSGMSHEYTRHGHFWFEGELVDMIGYFKDEF